MSTPHTRQKPRVFVARMLPDEVMTTLHQQFAIVRPRPGHEGNRGELLRTLRTVDAALCTLTEHIDAEALDAAPHLKIVANYAVGFNNIDLKAAQRRGVMVTNTPDVLTNATADLTWALILAVARRIPEGHSLVQQGRWAGWDPLQLLGNDVCGKTLGIIGFGRIGRAVARRAIGFDMAVLYHRRHGTVDRTPDEWRAASFQEVITEADFLTLHVPLSAETHHLLGHDELAGMKPTAYLINTSRGAVVDEAALVASLKTGQLAGAALDVYEREPHVHTGLRQLPNVVTLPHLGSATRTTRIQMGRICIDNIVAALSGREPPNRIV